MSRGVRGRLVEVSGVVYGVHVRGRLPAAFRPYLLPSSDDPGDPGRDLEVRYRLVDELPEVEEVWVSETEAPGPEAAPGRFALFRLRGGFGLTVSDQGQGLFRCTPRTIGIEWTASGTGTGAPHYLFTYALPLWLETRGVPVLHASAVCVGGRAVAFVGPSGMGKSVLSAELLGLGCGFLADDGLALRREEHREEGRDGEGGWHGLPGPPLLRLWPSGLEGRLEVAAAGLPRVHEALEKRRWTPPGEAAATPASGLPLAAVYVLERRGGRDGPVETSAYGARDALVRLLEHGVAAGPAAALGLSGRRLDLLADVAETVPVRRLRFPSGADSAERILDAIASQLGARS